MNELEQLIYDFLNKNTLMTMLDTDESREYTEGKAKELAALVEGKFAKQGGIKMYNVPPGIN